MKTKILLLLLMLLLLAACSSLRQPVQPQAKVNADATLNMAQLLERQGSLEKALKAYESALRQYQQFAGSQGQIYALAGMARLNTRIGDGLAYQDIRDHLRELTTYTLPTHAWVETALDLYLLQQKGDYEQIRTKAIVKDSDPDVAKLQILSYAVQAEAYLKQPDPSKVKQLETLARKAHKKLEQGGDADADLVSHAYYALAYHYYLQNSFAAAEKHISRSAELDYLFGNFSSLGYSLWLKAQILLKQGDEGQANALLIRARDIFSLEGDTDMLDKTYELLSNQDEGQKR